MSQYYLHSKLHLSTRYESNEERSNQIGGTRPTQAVNSGYDRIDVIFSHFVIVVFSYCTITLTMKFQFLNDMMMGG